MAVDVDEPTLAEVESLMRVVADVIRVHPQGERAVPVFESLERDRDRLLRLDRALARAHALSRDRRFE
jgi:hypothetical protein